MDATGLTVIYVLTSIYIVILVVAARRTNRELRAASPRGVIDHFSAHPKMTMTLDIRGGGFVWNPGAPMGPRNFLYGPGRARFTQDDQGLVHLDWEPRWGAARHFSGPPPTLPEPDRVPIRHTAKIVGMLVGIYILILFGWWAVSSR